MRKPSHYDCDLSANWWRPSYFAAKYMQNHGCRITPVNPNDVNIDILDVFRRVEKAPALARSAVAIKTKVFWLQLGLISDEAADIACQGGLDVVMDHCVKIEHGRLMGGLNDSCGSHDGYHDLPSQHYLDGRYSSYSSLILWGNDGLKPSLRQSDYLVQLVLAGYSR